MTTTATIDSADDAAGSLAESLGDSPRRRTEAEASLKREAHRRARLSGVSVELIEREMVEQQRGVDRAMENEDRVGGAFYRCEQRGGQRVLTLNAAHPFFLELYADPGTTARQRAAIELLLWTLGEAEVEAEPGSALQRWYLQERATAWSPNLAGAITALAQG